MINKFYCVLAIDGAGKSTLLDSVSDKPNWKLVTYDDAYVPKEYGIVNKIDDCIELETLGYFPKLGKDFKTSIYSTYIYYMSDMVKKYRPSFNILCNSYYYKILAKDVLQNGPNSHIHDHWRGLEQPDKIFFLDTPPEVAFKRVKSLSDLFPNEYYGETPTKDGFIKFQHNLRNLMLEEVKHLPLVKIDGSKSPSELKEIMEYELQF